MKSIHLAEKLTLFDEHFQPRTVGRANPVTSSGPDFCIDASSRWRPSEKIGGVLGKSLRAGEPALSLKLEMGGQS
jgi:hypothetical protein